MKKLSIDHEKMDMSVRIHPLIVKLCRLNFPYSFLQSHARITRILFFCHPDDHREEESVYIPVMSSDSSLCLG